MTCIRTLVPKRVAMVIEPRILLKSPSSEALAFESFLDPPFLDQSVLRPEQTAAKVISGGKLVMALARMGRTRDPGRLPLLAHTHLEICKIIHR